MHKAPEQRWRRPDESGAEQRTGMEAPPQSSTNRLKLSQLIGALSYALDMT